MIPGLGLVAGTANVARDIGRTRRAVKTISRVKPLKALARNVKRSRTGRQLEKISRKARKNPLSSVAAGGATTYVTSDIMDKKRGANLPRVPRPKLDQGVVGRRTAG